MKFSSNQHPTLDEIKAAIIKEFKKPKSESQSITELKEIQQRRGESVWDFNQRLKVLLDQVSFTISPAQHKEWFIVAYYRISEICSRNRRLLTSKRLWKSQ